jgi:hypothetical protein
MRAMLRSAIRVVVLAFAVLVVTASECPFFVFPGTGLFVCFTEMPVGPIAPGTTVLQLREFCPDGPVVGTIDIIFLGPQHGVPSPTYAKLPGGEIRIASGGFATDNTTIDVDGAPVAVRGLGVQVVRSSGIDLAHEVRILGFNARLEQICAEAFADVPDGSRLQLLCDEDLSQIQLEALNQGMELVGSVIELNPDARCLARCRGAAP